MEIIFAALFAAMIWAASCEEAKKVPPVSYVREGTVSGVVTGAYKIEHDCWKSCVSIKNNKNEYDVCFDGGQQDFRPYVNKHIIINYKKWRGGEIVPRNRVHCDHVKVTMEAVE